MRFQIVVVFVIVFCSNSLSQLKKLDQFENRVMNKIEIGMKPDEVKKKLGKPKTIEGGFPDIKNRILFEQPAQIGQINNSTWFYTFDNISIIHDYIGGVVYYVNGISVSEDIYNQYKDKLDVYMLGNEIIDTSMAKSYLSLKSPNLKKVNRDYRTEVKNEKPRKVTEIVRPIVCIIFDRGTQVVAAKKVFYLNVGIK